MNIESFKALGINAAVEYDFKYEVEKWNKKFQNNLSHWSYKTPKGEERRKRINCIANKITKTREEENLLRLLYSKSLYYGTYNNGRNQLYAGFDCDSSNESCDLTNEIYMKLWPLIDKNEPYGSDTMNSFWTSYKFAIQICEHEKVIGIRKSPNNHEITDILLNYSDYNEKFKLEKNKDIFSGLKEFARRAHTIGNFTCVPRRIKCFATGDRQTVNQKRYAKFYDYWDLTLNWFLKEDPAFFNMFVKEFDHEHYLYDENSVIDLFESDLKNDDKKPLQCGDIRVPDRDQLIRYLNNVNKLIQERGESLMVRLLNCV